VPGAFHEAPGDAISALSMELALGFFQNSKRAAKGATEVSEVRQVNARREENALHESSQVHRSGIRRRETPSLRVDLRKEEQARNCSMRGCS